MSLIIVSLFMFSYSVSVKINKKTNSYVYNHFNPVVDGDELINGSNKITFDAFFLEDKDNDGIAEGYRGTTIKNKSTEQLYINIKTNGEATVRNATLTFDSKNVTVGGIIPRNSLFSESIGSDNFGTIELDEVTTSINTLFTVNVKANIDKILSNYEADNKIILRGEIVDHETGTVTPFEKEVTYNVNSYSDKVKASFGVNKSDYQENTFTVRYELTVNETLNQSPLYNSILEGSVTKLLGQDPVSVNVYPAGRSNYTFTYNPSNLSFTAVKRAKIDNGVITSSAYNTISYGIRSTKWYVEVVYPEIEGMKEETVSLTATGYYNGIKNKDIETIESNKVTTVLSQELHIFEEVEADFTDKSIFNFGYIIDNEGTRYVEKTELTNYYRGNDYENITYNEYWNLESYLSPNRKSKVLYESVRTYVGSQEYIDNYITYKTIRISPCSSLLYANKSFKVINSQTNEVITTIKSSDYSQTITLPANVHRLNLETELLDESSKVCFNVMFEKEISTASIGANYNESEFQYSNITAGFNTTEILENESPNGASLPHRQSASFTDRISYVDITSDTHVYNREVSDYSVPITLRLSTNPANFQNLNKWEKGIYLLKIPDFVIDVKNLSITSQSTILSKDIFYKDGNYYLRVLFDTTDVANMDVSFNAIINPLVTSQEGIFVLYGYSEKPTVYSHGTADALDINGNGDTNEIVAYDQLHVTLEVPNEVITGNLISDFSSDNTVVSSPLTADVNPLRGTSDATITSYIYNNADNDIENIKLIGHVGFIGNTYVVGNGELGSEFDTSMKGPITIPNELNGHVTIYYSTNVNPSADLNEASNGWVQTPADYSLIKSYLIDFDDDIILEKGKRYDFEYTVELPESTDYLNKVSYITHGVFFEYITQAGNFPSQISAPRLGIRMARKYNANINLYKLYTNTKLGGGIFSLVSDEGDETTVLIGSDGSARVEGLRVDVNYTLTQKTATSNAIVNSNPVIFKINNETNDDLTLTKSGQYKDITFNGTDTLTINLENEITYDLLIHLYDNDTSDDIPNAVYKITGPNYEDGRNIVTDDYGNTYLSHLLIGEEYTVSQVYNYGYPTMKSFVIKLIRNESNHDIEITTRVKPSITLGSDCSNKFDYSLDVSGNGYLSTENYDLTEGTYICNFDIDLTNFSKDYKLTGDNTIGDYWGASNPSSAELYLTKGIDTSGLPYFFKHEKQSDYSGVTNFTKSFENDKASYNDNLLPSITNFSGGDNYTFKVVFNKSAYDGYGYETISNLKVEPKDGVYELLGTSDRSDVINSDNPNVSQTLTETSSKTTLSLDLTTKKVTTRPFEIYSIDSTNDDPVEGSQFRVTGPGIVGEKVLTTNSEGKATIDLYQSFSGYYQSLPGFENNPDYPIDNEYIIEQIYAPTGYVTNSKVIKFKLNADYAYNGNPFYSFIFTDKEEFDLSEVTNDPIFKGTLKSYPIFNLLKQDAETNDPLPNTYYAISSYDLDTGTESPAYDQYGNIIGEEITIDGNTYYVVKTDENGEIKLPLISGVYKLLEVIPSDDKYEINNEEYLFDVGEGIPSKPIAAKLVKAFMLSDTAQNNYMLPQIMKAEDNGYVAMIPMSNNEARIQKYDENYNLLWSKNIPMISKFKVYQVYDGDIDNAVLKTDETNTSYTSATMYLEEVSDGYYVYTENANLVKFDKTTGEVIYNVAEKLPRVRYEYWNTCPDDNTTYCWDHNDEYNNFSESSNMFDANDEEAIIELRNYNYDIKDIDTGEVFDMPSYAGFPVVVRLDANGNIKNVYTFESKISDAIVTFARNHNLDNPENYTYTFSGSNRQRIKLLSDGGFLIVDKGTVNSTTMVVAARFDRSGNIVYATPVGYNGGVILPPNYPYTNYEQLYEDGSFYISNVGNINNYGSNPLLSSAEFQFDAITENHNPTAWKLVEFDGEGKLSNVIEVSRYARNPSNYDTTNDYHRIFNPMFPLLVEKYKDGYIVVAGCPGYGDEMGKLILSNGELITLENQTKVIVYKIDKDSNVEWVKQYAGITTFNNHSVDAQIIDNHFVISVTNQTKKSY